MPSPAGKVRASLSFAGGWPLVPRGKVAPWDVARKTQAGVNGIQKETVCFHRMRFLNIKLGVRAVCKCFPGTHCSRDQMSVYREASATRFLRRLLISTITIICFLST